ncbi:hypothetical protein BS47DRAFT_1365840 [Hydnum rufescens UP504]|uniref:Uncharacterized protein n=1 Tax=Hydnum rufescens UP504 TaxID=1448309 RepID=A0A9P6DP31_9AGAM|nr:hypothetical protein BS47DRAFT_1365840 [Hydnum rufescens UP504]
MTVCFPPHHVIGRGKGNFPAELILQCVGPEALNHYVKYGPIDIPPSEGGGVRLKMSSFQEAVCFGGDHFEKETYEMLGELDGKVKIKWVMAHAPLGEWATAIPKAFVP